jgi:hypothetical protein
VTSGITFHLFKYLHKNYVAHFEHVYFSALNNSAQIHQILMNFITRNVISNVNRYDDLPHKQLKPTSLATKLDLELYCSISIANSQAYH